MGRLYFDLRPPTMCPQTLELKGNYYFKPFLSETGIKVKLIDPIVRAHCLDVELFIQISVVIVMKS